MMSNETIDVEPKHFERTPRRRKTQEMMYRLGVGGAVRLLAADGLAQG
jgi:hypothetical protein